MVAACTAREILDRVGFTTDDLRHPLDVLTVEAAAEAAGVAASTVNSAVGKANDFRIEVLRHGIRCLDTRPGLKTRTALRDGLASRGAVDELGNAPPTSLLANVFDARVDELANDPAIPLFLSAFDYAVDLETQWLVSRKLEQLVDDFFPLLATTRAVGGKSNANDPHPQTRFALLLLLLSATYRNLVHTDQADREVLAQLFGEVLDVELDREAQPSPLRPSVFGSEIHRCACSSEPLHQALTAGVRLLLEQQVPLSTSLSVTEVLSRSGVSTATFYRCFGSIHDFHLESIRHAGHRWIENSDLSRFLLDLERAESDAKARGETICYPRGLHLFLTSGSDIKHRQVADGRPGRQVTPWLGSQAIRPYVTATFSDAFAERGSFIQSLQNRLGATTRDGLTPSSMAAIAHSVGVVSDLLIRLSEDQSASTAHMIDVGVALGLATTNEHQPRSPS